VSRSSEWSLPFRLYIRNWVRISHLPHACYMQRPFHTLSLDYHSSSTWNLLSKALNLCSSFNVRYQVTHSYKTNYSSVHFDLYGFRHKTGRREILNWRDSPNLIYFLISQWKQF
jgi:hypothetical protein